MQARHKFLITSISLIGCLIAGNSIITTRMRAQNAERIKEAREIVKKADTQKYIKILESNKSENLEVWQKAAKQVQDSLKIDSIAKANYAKGAQMVRDSIKKANLNNTTKTILKTIK